MPELPKKAVADGFSKENLEVITDKNDLVGWLYNQQFQNTVVVFMSSGHYDGLNRKFSRKDNGSLIFIYIVALLLFQII